MTCNRLPIGDHGQRYEVRCIALDGQEIRLGWTDAADGGAFIQMVDAHPTWHSPRIIDREVPREAP